jgi:hypothetical protein
MARAITLYVVDAVGREAQWDRTRVGRRQHLCACLPPSIHHFAFGEPQRLRSPALAIAYNDRGVWTNGAVDELRLP